MANNNRINLAAPVLFIDYPVDDDPIWPCPHCLPWQVEIILDHPEGGVWVREWHAVGCQVWSY